MTNSAYMQRSITSQLVAWKDSPFRKPLILKGARQVGKTAVLKEFGKTHFQNTAYVSLEKINATQPSEYAEFFEQTLNPQHIVKKLSLALGQPIIPSSTLLILDEIQDCPAALNSLKYFCEEMPQLHVACAGSLLGIALSTNNSFPVGKVDFLTLYPMSFWEFLQATQEETLANYLKTTTVVEPVPQLFAAQFETALRAYFTVGGMPEAVLRWNMTGDISQVDAVLANLTDAYERDFAKHGGAAQYAKILQIWHSLPAQLARENKRFLYSAINKGARAREYEDAITWLAGAGLIYKVPRASSPSLPMSAYDERAFKLYLFDVGILRTLARLDASAFTTNDALFKEFRGAFAENYVLDALMSQLNVSPRYWSQEKPPHEVDYLIQVKNNIVPCEVKAGTNVRSPSLTYYTKKYSDKTTLRVRFSLKNLALDDELLNIPLYLCDQAIPLIAAALELGLVRRRENLQTR